MTTAAGFVAAGGMSMADGAFDDALKLEPADFTTVNITLDGKPVMLKRYEAVYVGRPVDMATEQPARRMGAGDTGQDWFAWTTGEGQALAAQVELVNPMAYLGGESKAAAHWYIRHGMIDRDASFTVALSLAAAARDDADVKDVNFALHWMTAHSGNYDVQAAYAWLADALASAE